MTPARQRASGEAREIMKTIIEIETADELLAFHEQVRAERDKTPYIRGKVTLVIDNGICRLQGEDGKYILSENVSQWDIFEAMAERLGVSLHLT